MSKSKPVSREVYNLSELIAYYELCNKAEGKSPSTISWYSANLRRFQSYLTDRHLKDSLDNINTKLLREYVLYLLERRRFEKHPYNRPTNEPLSVATIHCHVRTLRAFFGWLTREGITESNIAAGIKPPRLVKKIIATLSDEEIFSILSTFKPAEASQARNQVIFMLLVDTGLRIGELINLKIGDMKMDSGLLKVMGKGKKERMVPMGSQVQKALQRYLFRYRPKSGNTVFENVFLSIHGTPLTENSVKLMFARLSERSGVKRLHAHLCRHTFATRFLMNGGDIFTLQQILGHSTLEMVRHYVNLTSNHVAMQHHKYSPLDRLGLRKV